VHRVTARLKVSRRLEVPVPGKLRSAEPSFSSIKEKSFESRRVRSHPCTRIVSAGAVRCNASLMEVGVSMRKFCRTLAPGQVKRS